MATKKTGNPLGPPTKLNDETVVKIKQVAALDGSVEEMAYFCDVSKQTVYNWFKQYPALFDEVERLRAKPILKARQAVIQHLEDNYSNAIDYLKRKRKDEFGDSSTITHKIPTPIINLGDAIQSNDSNKQDNSTA